MKIILASKSPRRKELLGKIFDKFEIKTAPTDESLPDGMHPREGVELLAVRKGRAVAENNPEAMVISSDTLVELDGEALGKPREKEDAYRILRKLSGRTHNVHTGVAVHYCGRVYRGVHSSRVTFGELSDEQIYRYIETGEPMDKAGAYGIQGEGGKFVISFDGEFDSIMGLSISLTRSLVKAATGEGDSVVALYERRKKSDIKESDLN